MRVEDRTGGHRCLVLNNLYSGTGSKKKSCCREGVKQWVADMRFERLGCFTYSHEENTHAYNLEDDVTEEVKQQRANDIMEMQSQISWELNQQKIGQEFKVVIDRKEGNYFVGRTEYDSPDVDNEVLIDATKTYLKTGEFAHVKITEAADFDLYAEAVN